MRVSMFFVKRFETGFVVALVDMFNLCCFDAVVFDDDDDHIFLNFLNILMFSVLIFVGRKLG